MMRPKTYEERLQLFEPNHQKSQKSCCEKVLDKLKNAYGSTKSFAKGKPVIFGLICFGCIALLIIIIAVPVALSKKKLDEDLDEDQEDCSKNIYSDKCLYEKMIAKQSEYPTGTPWTSDNYYEWKGGIYTGGKGCAGFAFMLSDVCFGDIKAKQISCSGQFKVGDVVRILNNSHFVIITKMDSAKNKITTAEGNRNKAVFWGWPYTFQEFQNICTYILRRNPN